MPSFDTTRVSGEDVYTRSLETVRVFGEDGYVHYLDSSLVYILLSRLQVSFFFLFFFFFNKPFGVDPPEKSHLKKKSRANQSFNSGPF